MKKRKRDDRVDAHQAERRLEELWQLVTQEAEDGSRWPYVEDNGLVQAIDQCVNHSQVAYRFCLPVQLLGKVANPPLDVLSLQRGKDEDASSWDARSLASKVIAPFNARQEGVLGTSADPYVGNAMRIPRMRRDDSSKKDIAGWNRLIDVLENVQRRNSPEFTEAVFKQVLLAMHMRQASLRFSYPVPPRISLPGAMDLASKFLKEKSGGDRALALSGALFDLIGDKFGLFARVNRARINASDEASGQAADLECLNQAGDVVIAVEVKDRALTLSDVEGTITKSRHREIKDVLFAAPKVHAAYESKIAERVAKAFSAGQNLYIADFFELARAVLLLAGDAGRAEYLRLVGKHLDTWTTQPSHRRSWKKLLETV